ncbi:baseplate J/gp47 family protein [Paenibacillus chibensis]|uniref:baseplate J/gp47 family protein n=1 Tax=Paenibacillus chibensis TaxID=59846 RepID=UPI000FD7D5A4|nr:baseplate J/gp47 family protein [Paenibacillus chibensis]MEC0370893.1 baseplate J/gp47 family protein [Paenibacillus chibensis]
MDEIFKQLLADIGEQYDKTEGYLVYDLLKSVALALNTKAGRLDEIESLLDVENMTYPLLDIFVKQRKGIERNLATYSKGTLLVTGNGTINTGDLFETPSGVQFESKEKKSIVGTGQITVQARIAGPTGNVPAQMITQMPVTIPGITQVTNPEPTKDGYEEESDDSLRERYYIAVRTPPTSANTYHYLSWAKEISGVGAVKVFPLERGENTVEVVIIDQERKPASASLVAKVQEHIDPGSEGLGNGEAPIGAKCFVISASGLDINVTASVTKSSDLTDLEVLANIQLSIAEYLKGVAFISDYVSYARIGEAILNSSGVEDYSGLLLNGAADNVAVGRKEVAVLGVVSIG